jgi:hypothetical protein
LPLNRSDMTARANPVCAAQVNLRLASSVPTQLTDRLPNRTPMSVAVPHGVAVFFSVVDAAVRTFANKGYDGALTNLHV